MSPDDMRATVIAVMRYVDGREVDVAAGAVRQTALKKGNKEEK
jgi:hypothetical protein